MATFGNVDGNTVMTPQLTVNVKLLAVVHKVVVFVAATVKLKLPVTVGVPDTVPVEDADDKLRPVGKLPPVTA